MDHQELKQKLSADLKELKVDLSKRLPVGFRKELQNKLKRRVIIIGIPKSKIYQNLRFPNILKNWMRKRKLVR